MTNALYQAAIRELEQALAPRVVSRTLKEGLQEHHQTPETVGLEHFDQILKGPVFRQLQVSMPIDQAKETVAAILERLKHVAESPPEDADEPEAEAEADVAPADGGTNAAPPPALQRQEHELAALRAALKPFNLYFEWPEVQKLRAQVQLLEDEHRLEHEAEALVAEAHRQLASVRQKLEDHLVIQARELAELEEAFEQVASLGGVKVRRLENLIGHVRSAQGDRQLATAEVERARKIAKDLRKLVESTVYQEQVEATDAPENVTVDPAALSTEVSQRLEQLDREAEQHDVQRLEDDFVNLLHHLPDLAHRIGDVRRALERGRRVEQDVAALRSTLAAAAERQRTALLEEFSQIESQARDMPPEVDTAELLQAVTVARGVLETTLPSLEDTQYVRRLHRLALARRDELVRLEAEAEAQRAAGLADQRELLARGRAAVERYEAIARDRDALDALVEAVAALASAHREERLAADLSAAVRGAEEHLEATVAEHAEDARVRERAQLRALLSKVEGLPELDAVGARVGGVKRELVRLIDASADTAIEPVQMDTVRSMVAALRRDAIDTCRGHLERLAERASEIDAEELLGRIQTANNVLEDDVYPDVRQLENALRQQVEEHREASFAELRRLERDAAEYLGTSLPEADRLEAFLARSREQLESGGVSGDLQRGWGHLDDVRASVERRLADFEPRLDAALEAFRGVAMLNSEDVASVRRILKHLDSQREAFPRVSTGLRIQLERALEEAEILLAKLQEEVDATREIADRLMSGGVLDDVLGLLGGSAVAGDAEGPAAGSATSNGEPDSVEGWLASITGEAGVEAGAILTGGGWVAGALPFDADDVRARLAPIDRELGLLGRELDRGPVRVVTLEIADRVLMLAWLDAERRLILVLESPTNVSLIGHRLRTEMDGLQTRFRDSPDA